MKQELEQAAGAAVKNLFGVEAVVELTRPDGQFGDYATNVALQLSKQLGRPPRDIAADLVDVLETDLQDSVAELTIAGPGFINLRLHDRCLTAAIADPQSRKPYDSQTVLVEYSDPNPFKPLHAGHLYTTLMGDVIARLVEQGGGKVTRLNYGGDVGLHVGKSMWAIIEHLGGENPEKLAGIPEADRGAWLGSRYVEGNNAYEDDEAAKAKIIEANRRVYELHAAGDRDSPFARIYWTCRQWSYAFFEELYRQLEVVPFDRFIPESEVTPLGLETVRQQLAAGVYQESDGAVVYDGESRGLHTRVFINSQGLPTYETKEVGLLLTKWRDYHFDSSYVITASEQDQYMQVVLDSISRFEPVATERTRHINHGVVKLQGGVKMSSRRGNIVGALDIIDAARQAGAESGYETAESTVLAAIKYALLKVRIGSDVIYDPKESIALEGNSGPYLQYAHARACGILAKATESAGNLPDSFEPGERLLAVKLTEYNEVVDKAVSELMPHYICTYLYELAQTFNVFYEHNRVNGDSRAAERLALVRTYEETLRSGLMLLGITAPEKM